MSNKLKKKSSLKPQGYENRFQNALYKKVELMKLRFEKCMKTSAFSNPMQRLNENYLSWNLKRVICN